MAQEISDVINQRMGGGIAVAEDARVIKLFSPQDGAAKVRFLAQIQDLPVRRTIMDARVILNSRTGSVVMNRHVTLSACAIAQGDLTVEVARNQQVNQPDTPLAGGQTVVTNNTQIALREQGGSLQSVNTSADLNSVVRALNSLGATPNDLMSILQSMKSAGCLNARLEIN